VGGELKHWMVAITRLEHMWIHVKWTIGAKNAPKKNPSTLKGNEMNYILTQGEYDRLMLKGENAEKELADTLMDLCQRVADSEKSIKPYDWKEGDELIAYTCILTRIAEGSHMYIYCDTCPVRKICPYPHKEWSK